MNLLNSLTKVISKRRWIPVAICCVPGILIVVAIGFAVLTNLKTYTPGANPIFLLLTGLACPVGMGLMMWLMNRNMSHPQRHLTSKSDQKDVSAASRLADLREQRQILESEIAEMTRIAELEEQDDLLDASATTPDEMPIAAMR